MDTRRLTLLRHGQAQEPDSCPEDFERELTRRGVIEAQEIAAHIAHRAPLPELILVSPAERAWATACIVAEACELDEKQVRCARELYLASPETIWRLVTQCDPKLHHVLICGHNPGLAQIAGRLGPKPRHDDLPTGGLAAALWYHLTWEALQPETANHCDWDDPENIDDS